MFDLNQAEGTLFITMEDVPGENFKSLIRSRGSVYTIHGNVAFLGRSKPGTVFHKIWQEPGVVLRIKMFDYDYFAIFISRRDKRPFVTMA